MQTSMENGAAATLPDTSSSDTPPIPPLSAAQWAGLARLGDLGTHLGQLLDGPLAGPATAALDRAGELNGRHDLVHLAESMLSTIDALERAGLLAQLRDNAQFVAESLELLEPLASDWVARLKQMPVAELQANAKFALALLSKLRLTADFVEDELAGELTEKIVQAFGLMQRVQTDKAVIEALVQLGRIYRSGLLSRLGDIAEYVAGLEEGTDLESLFGGLIESVPKNSIGYAKNLLRSAEQAMEDTHKDDAHLGGYSGLIHLMRDKEVQRGLRMVSLLPLYLKRRMDSES